MNTPTNTPLQLFFDQLRDLHSMEVQLGESMSDLVSLCDNESLRGLLASHAYQNGNHIAEITAIFERHGESPGGDKCKAIEGLIEGGCTHLKAVPSPHTRDLMMIAHCLRIESYEMAAYEFTALLSRRLELMREAEILGGLLAEEKDMASALLLLEPHIFEAANTHAHSDTTRRAATPEMAPEA